MYFDHAHPSLLPCIRVTGNEVNKTYLGSETRRRCILGNTSTRSYPASWYSGRTRRTAGTCIRSRLLTNNESRQYYYIYYNTGSAVRQTPGPVRDAPVSWGPHTCLALGTNIRRIRRCSDTTSRDRRRSDRAFLLWRRNRLQKNWRKNVLPKTVCTFCLDDTCERTTVTHGEHSARVRFIPTRHTTGTYMEV